MADFKVRAYLPESPQNDLVKMVPQSGFFTSGIAPVPPETEQDVFKASLLTYFVESGCIAPERRDDVLFDFE